MRRHGFVEIKVLELIAGMLAQKIRLLLRFHTLCHNRKAQALAHRNNGLRQSDVPVARSYVLYPPGADLRWKLTGHTALTSSRCSCDPTVRRH